MGDDGRGAGVQTALDRWEGMLVWASVGEIVASIVGGW